MAILHLIRTAPSNLDNIILCLNLLNADDAIVLIDDGCYCLNYNELQKIDNNQLYIIEDHAAARAISVNDSHNRITFSQLIKLISTYNKTITWQ